MKAGQDHNIDAEQGLMGAILLNNDAYHRVSDIVEARHFFEPIHKTIWEIAGKLIGAGKLASPITMRTFLPADMMIGEMSARVYLAQLAASAVTIINAPDFARVIRDLADHRGISDLARQVQEQDGSADPAELAAWAIDGLDGIVAARSLGQVPSLTLQASVVRAVDAAAQAYQSDGALTGLSYGLRELDRKTSGLSKGELTILAGRPGQGKTMLALNFARCLGQASHKGIFYSLEMGDVSLSRRLISDMIFDESEVTHFRMKSGRINEADFHKIRDASEKLAKLPLRIEQQSGLSISQISARSRQMKRRQGLDFIIVDHMGHVQASDRYRGSKVNEVGEISSGLLRLARELDVAVVALAQLSRGVESRDNKRPTLADLRDSGNIEQDAATVFFVYREAYYLQNAEPKPGTPEYDAWQVKMENCLHELEIIISKQRDGPSSTIRAYVDVACNSVRDQGWTRDTWPDAMDERFAF
jgi:replicative DNA helicase